MRNTVIGLALAAALLGGLFFAASHRAERRPVNRTPTPEAIQAAAGSIGRGFVGSKRVGAWLLTCSAKPVIVGPDAQTAKDSKPDAPAGSPAAGESKTVNKEAGGETAGEKKRAISLGRCRTMLEYRQKAPPHRLAMTLAFRYLGGASGRLAVFVRYGTGKKDDTLYLRLPAGSLKLKVAGCGRGECVAVGVLPAGAGARLGEAGKGELVLPAGPDGKRRGTAVPFAGLAAALAAMQRAEG